MTSYETIMGFTGAEDFAFDEFGNAVSLDPNGNLVRQSRYGEEEYWAPAVTWGGGAGVAFLPNGDLIVSDGGSNLMRVTASGGVETILSGLEYPNGVDVDLEGFVYVSEQNAGRVRRVDPDGGAYEVIATGLNNPNGLAFSPDYQTLFCGSFGSGIVYAITRGEDGEWTSREFARTPGAPGDPAKDACIGLQAGAPCYTWGSGEVCTETDLGLVCMTPDPCGAADLGDECVTASDENGLCADQGGSLVCNPCAGAQEDAPCTDAEGRPGACQPDPEEGSLFCIAPSPCDGLEENDVCIDDQGQPGVCQFDNYEGLFVCVLPPPCDGLSAGDDCITQWGLPGQCEELGYDYLECAPIAECDDAQNGDPCVSYDGSPGVCHVYFDYYGQYGWCEALPPCANAEPGDSCTNEGVEGTCLSVNHQLDCLETAPCEGQEPWSSCQLAFGELGVCAGAPGPLFCREPDSCDGLAPGAACEAEVYTMAIPGTCQAEDDGPYLPPGPLAGGGAGGSGPLAMGGEGGAPESAGGAGGASGGAGGETVLDQRCVAAESCENLEEGDYCLFDGYDVGVCGPVTELCSDSCELSYNGTCDDGGPGSESDFCPYGSDCADCGSRSTQGEGGAGGAGGDTIGCVQFQPCAGLNEGDPCTTPWGENGTCTGYWYGDLECQTSYYGSSGGLDGIGVDACGFVYVTEYIVGNVWRIAPDGSAVELVVNLPASWIPNVNFGPGIGGWDEDVLYVFERDNGNMFGVHVGIPGRPMPYPPSESE